jgi:membrane-bound ClpP family serine protease
MWSRQVILKYSLLQLPGLVTLILILLMLRQWTTIPSWIFLMCASIWIIKDVILFPFVWRAYENNLPNSMVGSSGIAVDQLSPSGYVRINGELWRAKIIENESVIEKGETITVRDMDGLTLTVISGEKEKAG